MTQFSLDLLLVNRYMRRHREIFMEQYGLKGIHGRIILAICHNPGSSQDRLAAIVHLDKSTVARGVETLENQGFVTRKPAQNNKRILCVYPTEKAEQLLPKLVAAMQDWENSLLKDLTEEEKQQLQGLLARVRATAEGGK